MCAIFKVNVSEPMDVIKYKIVLSRYGGRLRTKRLHY